MSQMEALLLEEKVIRSGRLRIVGHRGERSDHQHHPDSKIQSISTQSLMDQVNFKKGCGSFAVRRTRRVARILLRVTLDWTRKRESSVNKGGSADMDTPCLRAARWCQQMAPPRNPEGTQEHLQLFLNLRGFWYSEACVCMDIPEFFSLAAPRPWWTNHSTAFTPDIQQEGLHSPPTAALGTTR